ncbi:hypothetical protein ACFLXQ_07440, partial [Chloroflexota bacterium]
GIDTAFTLVLTPDDGNRKHNVGFDLYESNDLRDWVPDNPLGITPFGSGSVVDRDGDPNTGEQVWRGQVLAYDKYYMRVRNGTGTVIDFWIFPDNMINTSLE